MAYEATPGETGAVRALRRSEALRVAWRIAWTTRLAVVLVAVFAALSFGPAAGGLAEENAAKFDAPVLTHPLADPLVSPLARWDAVWYLRIADSGYGGSDTRSAFFPLYPLLVRALAMPLGGTPSALLVAAYAVALAAFVAALALLYRLVALELGRPLARPALLLLAVFPAAVFFSAPYAESLFLALAVGAFLAARTDRWAWAGACAAGAAATRSAGVLLLLPLAMLWWDSRGRRARDAAWLALAPLGLAAYALFLGLSEGDALRFLDVQDAWSRELTVPLAGAWDGLVAAWDGLRQLASGQKQTVYFEAAAGDPYRIAATNLMLFGTLVFAVAACVGVLRRLPAAYGAWVALSLALPLTFPVKPQPLMSLPRFVAVLFPIFMWLALWCEERRATERVAALSAVGLGLFTAQYASWHWVS
ncbi:MAG: mannosyltransferase family protein [Thermoleophilaceae bacterium]